MIQKIGMVVLAMSLLMACQKTEDLALQPLPTIKEGFMLVSTANFSSLNGYTVTGKLEVWKDSLSYEFRFIDFRSSNGPDLDILVSRGPSTNPSITLGDIKGAQGNFVYTFTDNDNRIKDFSSVVVWCARLSVAFGIANFEQ